MSKSQSGLFYSARPPSLLYYKLGEKTSDSDGTAFGGPFEYYDYQELLPVCPKERFEDSSGNSVAAYDQIDELLTNYGAKRDFL